MITYFKFDYHMIVHDLDLLRCFCVVADCQSFTTAGVRLGRSQSAISVRIKRLETVLGWSLFVRNSAQVRLTERGRSFLPKTKQLLAQSERLFAEAKGTLVSGRLRVGILEYIAPHRLPDLLQAVQRRLPDAELQFRVGLSQALIAGVRHGEIDLALAVHDPENEASTPLAEDPLVWVEGPTTGEPASPAVDLCLMRAPCLYRQAALEALSSAGMPYREVLITNSVQSVRSAVLSGIGISLLGASCIGDGLLPSRRLQALGPLPPVILSLHGADPRKDEVAAVFRAILADHLTIDGDRSRP